MPSPILAFGNIRQFVQSPGAELTASTRYDADRVGAGTTARWSSFHVCHFSDGYLPKTATLSAADPSQQRNKLCVQTTIPRYDRCVAWNIGGNALTGRTPEQPSFYVAFRADSTITPIRITDAGFAPVWNGILQRFKRLPQKHLRCTTEGPNSSYSALLIHIC